MNEMDQIRTKLWNAELGDDDYPDSPFQRDLLAQYMMCIEMADRISSRRGTANAFFLTFHTAVIAAMSGYFGGQDTSIPAPVLFVIVAVLVVFCVAWGLLLSSYRSLNTAKFKVIGLMEERLPASPYYSAEWQALGLGKDWSKYIPLSLLEKTLPGIFLFAYLCLAYIKLNSGG